MKRYNATAAEKTLAAYETSTDYERLHELARQDIKFPAFSGTICTAKIRCFSAWQSVKKSAIVSKLWKPAEERQFTKSYLFETKKNP